MDETRVRAYRLLLAQGLLHLKWDLACLLGGFSWLRPRLALAQARAARKAALRAYAFHNLAIRSAFDFAGLLGGGVLGGHRQVSPGLSRRPVPIPRRL